MTAFGISLTTFDSNFDQHLSWKLKIEHYFLIDFTVDFTEEVCRLILASS